MTDDNLVHISGNQRVLTPAEAALEDAKELKEQIKALTARIERLENEVRGVKE